MLCDTMIRCSFWLLQIFISFAGVIYKHVQFYCYYELALRRGMPDNDLGATRVKLVILNHYVSI